jgi:hypothetical protein
METLAYLYGAEDYEQSEQKELDLSGLKAMATTGLVAAGIAAGGVLTQADSASAHYYGGYHHRPVSYRYHSYYRPVYYPRHYYAYPVHYRPCYRGYYY